MKLIKRGKVYHIRYTNEKGVLTSVSTHCNNAVDAEAYQTKWTIEGKPNNSYLKNVNDVLDYYYINVSSATSSVNQFNNFSFELKDIFPNPINNNAKIQFISGNSAGVVFTVFNYLGDKIEERKIVANRGVNDIEISANNYANGMYLYSINNGVQILSKRMIIAN